MSQIAVQKSDKSETPQTVARRRSVGPFSLMREMLGWEPFGEIMPLLNRGESLRFEPAFEVKESGDSFLFKADLPGVKENDLEVTVTGSRLTISGAREQEKEEKGDTYYTYERAYGNFSRSFTLPDEADLEHLGAELKGGVLTVAVPKRAAAVARKISVSSGDKSKA